MRLSIVLLTAPLLAACAATTPTTPPPAPVVACTPATMVEAGRKGTLLPATCDATNPDTRERYAIGQQLARVQEKLAEVNYLIASSDSGGRYGGPRYGGLAGRGYWIGRRVELKNIRRGLRMQAGIL